MILKILTLQVLILVLVDHTLGVMEKIIYGQPIEVLILVLVDHTLGAMRCLVACIKFRRS